jgi:integrase
MSTSNIEARRHVSFLSEGTDDMARRRGSQKGHLYEKSGSWLLRYRIYTREHPKGHIETVRIGPAEGAGKLGKKQAQAFADEHYLKPINSAITKPISTLTVGEYWEKHYEPFLRKSRKYATQSQYVSLWKWLEPSCGRVRLWEWAPEHIDQAIAAALKAGKSTATADHIKKVASAVFAHAKLKRFASGDNPASAVDPIIVEPVREVRSLTWEQAQRLIGQLPDPARTMVAMSITMSMNVSEMLGLREKHVNLTDIPQIFDGIDAAPSHEIAVREHLYHGRRGSLKAGSRKRNVPIPVLLETMLAELIARNTQRGPDAPIFQTRKGTAHSADNLAKRVLKPVATALGMPWLSWHVCRHTFATFTKIAGMSDYDRQRTMGHASMDMTDRYSHEDKTRIRAGLEVVAEKLFGIETSGKVM